ncbi:hypothetical protein N1031_03310 [Herbiconiux moechotypicola]|uniref:Uncharacterized protein n=1 Tax=Herbiconiux moechotypicola TaxID=637393 RepID=A0ABN3DBZ6_9MICO|nr:hypothetical protein [Herbiconiux moechotypicola]MCS5728777.1 hypothetical protein [Herbiconiux moechotypicola]
MARNADPATGNAVYFAALGIIGAGSTILALSHATQSEAIDRLTTILGLVVGSLAIYGLAVGLISAWSWSAARAVATETPDAVIVRAGASPHLRRLLDEDRTMRSVLAARRPLGRYFLLVVTPDGLQVRHGGREPADAVMDAASVVSVTAGTTREGLWTLRALWLAIVVDGQAREFPVVMWARFGVFSASSAVVETAARRVRLALV